MLETHWCKEYAYGCDVTQDQCMVYFAMNVCNKHQPNRRQISLTNRKIKSQALKWDLHLFGAWRLCWFDFLALRLLEVFEEETRKVQTFEMTLGAIFYSHVFKNVKKLYMLQVFWEYLKWFSARKKNVFFKFRRFGQLRFFEPWASGAGSNSWGICLPPSAVILSGFFLCRFWT